MCKTGKTIYDYTIEVIAENETKVEYFLTVEILEANFGILNVLCGEVEETLEPAILKEDGTYHYKIGDVEKAYIEILLESEKSKVEIAGVEGNKAEVNTPDEITKVIIKVIAEDESKKEYTLIIEKKSSDLSIKEITGDGVIETNLQTGVAYVYIDEDLSKVDLIITLNHELASLKLAEETDYEINKMTRTVDLSDCWTIGEKELNLNLQAENGRQEDYILKVYIRPNLELESVTTNGENTEYNSENERYEHVVPNGDKPTLIIKAKNSKQTVQLLNKDGVVLGENVGTLNILPILNTNQLEDNFKIKVISYHGEIARIRRI